MFRIHRRQIMHIRPLQIANIPSIRIRCNKNYTPHAKNKHSSRHPRLHKGRRPDQRIQKA